MGRWPRWGGNWPTLFAVLLESLQGKNGKFIDFFGKNMTAQEMADKMKQAILENRADEEEKKERRGGGVSDADEEDGSTNAASTTQQGRLIRCSMNDYVAPCSTFAAHSKVYVQEVCAIHMPRVYVKGLCAGHAQQVFSLGHAN